MKAVNKPGVLLAWWFGCLLPAPIWGQDSAKIEARIELNYFQVNNEIPYLTARVRTKTEKGWVPVKWVIVNLFLNQETKLGMMGNITTDSKGDGKYILPSKFKAAWDSLDKFTFMARIMSDEKVMDAKKEIIIKKSSLQIDTKEEDSVRTILISFKEKRGKEWMEVSDVELKPFMNRNFGKLPIGDGAFTTDETGSAKVEFSAQLPGDKNGSIFVGGSIEDHEDYGNITSMKSVAWGLPLARNEDFFKQRTLWSTRERTPIWLLVGPNLMILLVWGVIGYLIYQLVVMYRIYKKGLTNE